MKKFLFFNFAFLIFISGCAGLMQRTQRQGPYVEPASTQISDMLKFDDVPIPAGFKSVDNDSFTFQNRDLRLGLLKYTGRVHPDKVVAFFKENMPLYNWSLINVVEYGRRIMNFERAGQSCIVTIEPTSFYTVLIVAVAPRASAPMKEDVRDLREYKGVK